VAAKRCPGWSRGGYEVDKLRLKWLGYAQGELAVADVCPRLLRLIRYDICLKWSQAGSGRFEVGLKCARCAQGA
jgi:hypothetical protein